MQNHKEMKYSYMSNISCLTDVILFYVANRKSYSFHGSHFTDEKITARGK